MCADTGVVSAHFLLKNLDILAGKLYN